MTKATHIQMHRARERSKAQVNVCDSRKMFIPDINHAGLTLGEFYEYLSELKKLNQSK